MKFLGLDGKEHITTLVLKKRGKVSTHHERARKLLKELFPLEQIFEEVTLPGSKTAKNGTLYADFYIHSRQLMVEVQGEQHTSYNSFFHSNKLEFHKGRARDKAKREWCQINDITLIELPYGETDEQWRKRIDS